VWSKALSSFLLAWAILLAVLAIGMTLFGIRILGSPLGFLAITLATAAMAAGFGLAIATVGKTETQARGMSILLILIMLATGGAWFPIQRMPDWVQSMAHWLPVRWAVEGLDAVTWRGLSFSTSVQNAEVLTAFALVFLAIATWRFGIEAKRAN
jgi:ABC-2 type transport system permease protein